MGFVYLTVLLVLAAAALLCGGYQKKRFQKLDKKEHPIRLFYPLAAKLIDGFSKQTKAGKQPETEALLKSLYVKENVQTELYLFRVRKVALLLTVLLAAALFGSLLSLSRAGERAVTELLRNDPGKGTEQYALQAEYQGKTEDIQISVEEAQLSEAEIRKKMDAEIEALKKEMLGANESADAVSQPLSLPSLFGELEVLWEIDAPDVLGYDGEIRATLKEKETRDVTLKATLTLEDVSQTYNIPIRLVAPKASAQEALQKAVTERVEETNDPQQKTVQLPKSVNGKKVTFRKPKEDQSGALLVLSLVAAFAVVFLSGKGLEEKLKKRKEEMMADFPEIVSKLSLLHEAGASIRGAFERIVADQERKGEMRFAYREMKLVLEKVRSGTSERQAYAEFGRRCGLHPYIKLGNILEQNLSMGAKGMKLQLEQEVTEALEARKRLARKKGEEAGTKLLVPMILMLCVVIVIVAVPALMSMQI